MKRLTEWFFSDSGGGRFLFWANAGFAGATLVFCVLSRDSTYLLLAAINGLCAFWNRDCA